MGIACRRSCLTIHIQTCFILNVYTIETIFGVIIWAIKEANICFSWFFFILCLSLSLCVFVFLSLSSFILIR